MKNIVNEISETLIKMMIGCIWKINNILLARVYWFLEVIIENIDEKVKITLKLYNMNKKILFF